MMRNLMRRARLIFLFVGLVGCGGSPESDGSEITPEQAQADCARFVSEVYCPAFKACLPDETMDECLATISRLDCSAVQGENGKLPDCEYQLTHSPCKYKVGDGSIRALPLSCTGVFRSEPAS
jgi:hypothetical protein